jgi:hypothetical protein
MGSFPLTHIFQDGYCTTNQLRKRHRTGIPPNKSLDCSHTAGQMGRCTRDQRTGGQNLQESPFCWGETTSFPDTTVYTYLFTNYILLHTCMILIYYVYMYIYMRIYTYTYRHEQYIYIYMHTYPIYGYVSHRNKWVVSSGSSTRHIQNTSTRSTRTSNTCPARWRVSPTLWVAPNRREGQGSKDGKET